MVVEKRIKPIKIKVSLIVKILTHEKTEMHAESDKIDLLGSFSLACSCIVDKIDSYLVQHKKIKHKAKIYSQELIKLAT